MAWNNPECVYCNKSIGKPSDAIFTYSMKGAQFGHVECYAKLLGQYAQDGKLLSVGGAVAGGNVVGALAGYRKAEEMENAATGKSRAQMQKIISSTSTYQIVGGALFFAMGAFVFANAAKIKLDMLGWGAAAVLTLIGIGMLYFGMMYRIKLKEFEKRL